MKEALTDGEVVLCAGAIGSPIILQRSGIGAPALLANHGIPVAHDLPGVGENLQDHLEVYFQYRCREPITLNGHPLPPGQARASAPAGC